MTLFLICACVITIFLVRGWFHVEKIEDSVTSWVFYISAERSCSNIVNYINNLQKPVDQEGSLIEMNEIHVNTWNDVSKYLDWKYRKNFIKLLLLSYFKGNLSPSDLFKKNAPILEHLPDKIPHSITNLYANQCQRLGLYRGYLSAHTPGNFKAMEALLIKADKDFNDLG